MYEPELIANLLNAVHDAIDEKRLTLEPDADLGPAFADAAAYLRKWGYAQNSIDDRWQPVYTLR